MLMMTLEEEPRATIIQMQKEGKGLYWPDMVGLPVLQKFLNGLCRIESTLTQEKLKSVLYTFLIVGLI